jgi:cytochrome b561
MQTTQLKYSTGAIVIHWVSALLMIYMLFWGEGLIRGEGGAAPSNPMLHASLGITILILSILRLVWRFMNPPPPDVPMPVWQAKFSHYLHWGFYALLILIPLSGMAALDRSIAGKHPEFSSLTFFNLFPVPHFSMTWFGQTHDLMTKLGIALLILHVLGALKHQFIDKDNLLKRMSPH